MRLAYADPPYIGQAKKHYGDRPDYAGEVDHARLIESLLVFDGWALSCHVNSLREILPLCPDGIRVGAWVKPFAFFKKGVRPSYAWEPVIFKSARSDKERTLAFGGKAPMCRDWVSANVWGVRASERTNPVNGKKRVEVCEWIFGLTGAVPGDEFHDLFPGSGGVMDAWLAWRPMTLAPKEGT